MHASEKGVNTTILGVNNDLPWCQEDVSHFLASLTAPWCRGNPWSGPQNDGVPLFNIHDRTTHTTSQTEGPAATEAYPTGRPEES